MVAGLRALPRILRGAVPALEAQILDVGLACLSDPQPVEAEQDSERCVVAVEAFGGEQEHTELAAIQTSRLGRMDLWSSDVLGWVERDDPVDVCESVEAAHRRQPTIDGGCGQTALLDGYSDQFDVRTRRTHHLDLVIVSPLEEPAQIFPIRLECRAVVARQERGPSHPLLIEASAGRLVRINVVDALSSDVMTDLRVVAEFQQNHAR
jgi:hypothetical protein